MPRIGGAFWCRTVGQSPVIGGVSAPILGAILLLWALAPTAQAAMTPAYICTHDLELALGASSPELALRSAEVTRREGELRLAELGLSTLVTVTTGVDVGANLLRDEDPAWGTSLQMDAGLGYRYDEIAIIRARSALTTAQKREADQKRADVLAALLSLSRLRAAERLTAQTDATAAEAERLAASVRQSAITAEAASAGTEMQHDTSGDPDAGLGPDFAADIAQDLAPDLVLNIRELDLAAAKARATASGRADDLAEALAELARLGVEPTAALQFGALASSLVAGDGPAACLDVEATPLQRAEGPHLPTPSGHGSAERELLRHASDLTAAQSRRAALGPLRDLSMTAHYQEGGARVLAELELDGGRPAAGVNVRLRDTASHNWGVGVSATIRLDDSMGAALASAITQREAAQAALNEFDAAFPQRLANSQVVVESAWLQLAFAVEAVSIAGGRLELAATEHDVTRAEQVLSRSVDALEREYQTYLRALGRFLTEFDVPWSALVGAK